MKILSLITHSHSVPNPQDLRSSSEHKLRYVWWNSRMFWPWIDSNATDTFKVQKGSKDIFKIVHVTSLAQQYIMKVWEYFFAQRKQNQQLYFNNSSPPCHHLPPLMRVAWWHAPRHAAPCYKRRNAHVWTLMNDGGWCHKGEELLNKVWIKHKKYSRCFVKLRMNHWCHMYYFNDCPYNFSGPGNISLSLLSMRVRNILIWVLKLNDRLAQEAFMPIKKEGTTCFLRFFCIFDTQVWLDH